MDRYGRTIATVHLPDVTNLNEELVRVGLAWAYPRYCDERPCAQSGTSFSRRPGRTRLGFGLIRSQCRRGSGGEGDEWKKNICPIIRAK